MRAIFNNLFISSILATAIKNIVHLNKKISSLNDQVLEI